MTTINSLSGVSLNAVTSTGAGQVFGWGTPMTAAAIQVSTTGSPASYEVDLQGSVDGTNFFQMASATQSQPAASSNNSWVVTAVRANLITFSGGTMPTFTAYIAVA